MLNVDLEDGAGMLFILLTISGTKGGESISDLASFKPDPNVARMLQRRYVSSLCFCLCGCGCVRGDVIEWISGTKSRERI